MSGTTRVREYQKGKTRKVKTNLDLLEQETVSGRSLSWATCKPAPRPRRITTTQFFYRLDTLPATQPTASKHWRHLRQYKTVYTVTYIRKLQPLSVRLG